MGGLAAAGAREGLGLQGQGLGLGQAGPFGLGRLAPGFHQGAAPLQVAPHGRAQVLHGGLGFPRAGQRLLQAGQQGGKLGRGLGPQLGTGQAGVAQGGQDAGQFLLLGLQGLVDLAGLAAQFSGLLGLAAQAALQALGQAGQARGPPGLAGGLGQGLLQGGQGLGLGGQGAQGLAQGRGALGQQASVQKPHGQGLQHGLALLDQLAPSGLQLGAPGLQFLDLALAQLVEAPALGLGLVQVLGRLLAAGAGLLQGKLQLLVGALVGFELGPEGLQAAAGLLEELLAEDPALGMAVAVEAVGLHLAQPAPQAQGLGPAGLEPGGHLQAGGLQLGHRGQGGAPGLGRGLLAGGGLTSRRAQAGGGGLELGLQFLHLAGQFLLELAALLVQAGQGLVADQGAAPDADDGPAILQGLAQVLAGQVAGQVAGQGVAVAAQSGVQLRADSRQEPPELLDQGREFGYAGCGLRHRANPRRWQFMDLR